MDIDEERMVHLVSTRTGDALSYYERPAIRHLCVPPADPAGLADALLDLAGSYSRFSQEFAENAAVLRARHARSGDLLAGLVLEARS